MHGKHNVCFNNAAVCIAPDMPHGTADHPRELLSEVANSNVNASIVEKLNVALSDSAGDKVKLGETGGKFVFFREWYNTITPVYYPGRSASTNVDDLNVRAALLQRKQALGYNDNDTQFRGVTFFMLWEHQVPVDDLLRDSNNLYYEILRSYSLSSDSANRFGNSSEIFLHYPFYPTLETLSEKEKNVIYRHLAEDSQSYSTFLIQNKGRESEYDLRVTAAVSPNDVDTNVLTLSSILIDQVVRDSVRFKIPYLPADAKGYKLLVFQRSGIGSRPVTSEDVKLDDTPLVQQIADHYWNPCSSNPPAESQRPRNCLLRQCITSPCSNLVVTHVGCNSCNQAYVAIGIEVESYECTRAGNFHSCLPPSA